MARWSKAGVVERVFARWQQEQIVAIKVEAVGLDSASITVHPDGTGARKKMARKSSAEAGAAGPPKFIWSPRLVGAR